MLPSCMSLFIALAISHVGSWGQIDAWGYSQKDSQKFIGNGLDGKAPLEHRLVLSQVPLAHAVEPTEEVPNMRPYPLLGVAVDLTYPIPVVIPRPGGLRPRVVHCLVAPPHPGQSVVPFPLVGVHHGPLQRRALDDLLQLRRVGVVEHLRAEFTGLPPDHPGDRRAVVLERAVAPATVGTPSGRVRRVVVRDACYETGCQALSIKTRMTRGSACYSCSRHQIGSAIASEGRRLFCAGPGPQGVTTRYPQLADPRWLRPDSLRSTCRSGSTWTSSKH